MERYLTCGNRACKCAQSERHGPLWYLTVTLGRGRTRGRIVPTENVDQVRGWIENYDQVQEHLEKSRRSTGNCCGGNATNSGNASAEEA